MDIKVKLNDTKMAKKAWTESEKVAQAMKWRTQTIDTLFIGVMKVAESNPSDEADIQEVKRLLKRIEPWKQSPTTLRWSMRDSLLSTIDEHKEEAAINSLRALLAEYDVVDVVLILDTILAKYRTERINTLLKEVEETTEEPEKKEPVKNEKTAPKRFIRQKEASQSSKMESMIELNNDVRGAVLANVKGQNEAVNLFIDELWNNELNHLVSAKKKRNGGVFTIIGKPNIGKTYLVEEVAEKSNCKLLELDMKKYAGAGGYKALLNKNGVLANFVGSTRGQKAFIAIKNLQFAHDETKRAFYEITVAGTCSELSVDFENIILVFTADIEDFDIDYFNSINGRDPILLNDQLMKSGLSAELLEDRDKNIKLLTLINSNFPGQILDASKLIYFADPDVHVLEQVCRNSFDMISDQLSASFEMEIEANDDVLTALLLSGSVDYNTRSLAKYAKKFVSNEMMKLFGLYKPQSATTAIHNMKKIKFVADLKHEDTSIQKLFRHPNGSNLLFIRSKLDYDWVEALKNRYLPFFNLEFARNMEEAEELICTKDIQAVLVQFDSQMPIGDDVEAERLVGSYGFSDFREDTVKAREDAIKVDTSIPKTQKMFDYAPLGASDFRESVLELRTLCTKHAKIPVYILETDRMYLPREMKNEFIKEGAKGFVKKTNDIGAFALRLKEIGTEDYIKSQIAYLKNNSMVLNFETVPAFEDDTVAIRLKHFSLKKIVSKEDQEVDVDASDSIKERFTDVIGAKSAKEELETFVEYLKNPAAYVARGARAPRGVLIYGRPGTGKTMLAKAFAGEAGVAFIKLDGSSLKSKYYGESAKAVRDLFAKARRYAPCIVFIDEIDTIAKTRTGTDQSSADESILTTLLSEMDGVRTDPEHPVFVVGATNYGISGSSTGIGGTIDDALIRRFDRAILVDIPDRRGRMEFIKLKVKDSQIFDVTGMDIASLADRTVGLSLAQIDNIIELAKRNAARKNCSVDSKILNTAYEEIVYGDASIQSKEAIKRTAYHEAGHALVGYKYKKIAQYISITARRNFGGITEFGENYMGETRDELLATISCLLAGRAAEMVEFGNQGISSGIADDLKKANMIAKAIVCELGMDDEFGLVYINNDSSNSFYSEKVHEKIKNILSNEMQNAIDIIKNNKRVLDALAEKLLLNNHLTRNEIIDTIEDNL